MYRTLLERLKPEYKAALNELEGECPNLVLDVQDGLERILFVVDIPFSAVNAMDILFNDYKGMHIRTVRDIWSMFEDN